MGLLSLILNVRANTDDARRKLRALDHTVTQSARNSMKNFRTAFTTFFSVSAMRMLILKTMEWAKNFETVRKEIEAMGLKIDSEIIRKGQIAELEWRRFGYQIRIGMLSWLPAVAGFFRDIARSIQVAATFWGVMASKTGGGLFSGVNVLGREGLGGLASRQNPLRHQAALAQKVLGMMETFGHEGAMSGLKGEGGGKNLEEFKRQLGELQAEWKRLDAMLESIRSSEQADILAELNKSKGGAGSTKGLEVPSMSGPYDALAAIGGFRSLSSMQDRLTDVAVKQLAQLESIKGNTESLKGGML